VIQLKGSVQGKEVIFETHERPHLDEIGAIFLIETFGTEEFLSRCAPEGIIRLGIGGGDFDEHPRSGQERKNDDCTTTLVAKAMNIYEEPALEKILKFIYNTDAKGSSHPFDLATLTTLRYQRYEDQEGTVAMTLEDIRTFYNAQLQFFTTAKEEFEKRAIIDEIVNGNRTYKIVSIVSDNPMVNRFARSVHGADASVVIQKNTSGHTQIFTNQRHGVVLYDVVQMVRIKEQMCKGINGTITDWKILASDGKIDGLPEWYFQEQGQILLNGSLTNQDAPPTRLKLDNIRKIVQIALDRQKFPISHANECRRGICTSSKREPCEFYPCGLHRCRKIRYDMKNSK